MIKAVIYSKHLNTVKVVIYSISGTTPSVKYYLCFAGENAKVQGV